MKLRWSQMLQMRHGNHRKWTAFTTNKPPKMQVRSPHPPPLKKKRKPTIKIKKKPVQTKDGRLSGQNEWTHFFFLGTR